MWMDENGCKWMNDDGDVEEGMVMDQNGWWRMKMDGDGWKWFKLDVNGWMMTVMDRKGWWWIKMVKTVSKRIVLNPGRPRWDGSQPLPLSSFFQALGWATHIHIRKYQQILNNKKKRWAVPISANWNTNGLHKCTKYVWNPNLICTIIKTWDII